MHSIGNLQFPCPSLDSRLLRTIADQQQSYRGNPAHGVQQQVETMPLAQHSRPPDNYVPLPPQRAAKLVAEPLSSSEFLRIGSTGDIA